MHKKRQSFLVLFVLAYWAFPVNIQAQEPILANCQVYFEKTGKCPEEVCDVGCLEGIIYEGCKMGCVPKPCFEIESQYCPEDTCQVVQGCEGKDVCFPRNEVSPPKCGGLAYSGGDVECCSGLVKRCGVEFFDGSCDLVGKYSMYTIPICIPCGNGVCNQFENSCNCPEDCHKEFATDMEYKGFRGETTEDDIEDGDTDPDRKISENNTTEDKTNSEIKNKEIPDK
ncbi:MAG: hypothetical protein AB7S78_04715 [Candidatus Omnitrophota bacterium]